MIKWNILIELRKYFSSFYCALSPHPIQNKTLKKIQHVFQQVGKSNGVQFCKNFSSATQLISSEPIDFHPYRSIHLLTRQRKISVKTNRIYIWNLFPFQSYLFDIRSIENFWNLEIMYNSHCIISNIYHRNIGKSPNHLITCQFPLVDSNFLITKRNTFEFDFYIYL